jgi:hypothetical protein
MDQCCVFCSLPNGAASTATMTYLCTAGIACPRTPFTRPLLLRVPSGDIIRKTRWVYLGWSGMKLLKVLDCILSFSYSVISVFGYRGMWKVHLSDSHKSGILHRLLPVARLSECSQCHHWRNGPKVEIIRTKKKSLALSFRGSLRKHHLFKTECYQGQW